MNALLAHGLVHSGVKNAKARKTQSKRSEISCLKLLPVSQCDSLASFNPETITQAASGSPDAAAQSGAELL